MDILKIYAKALAEYKAKNFSKAIEHQNKVKKINPAWTKNLLLEAYIYREQNLHLQEIATLENFLPKIDLSIESEKDLAAVGYSLLGAAYRMISKPESAVKFFLRSAELESNFEKSCAEISNAIFSANDCENFSAGDFERLYRIYREKISDIKQFPKKFYNHAKIKIGYLSADFCEHPVTNFILSLIVGRDKNNFEIYCYSAGTARDWITEKIISEVDGWRDISAVENFRAAEMIRADEIDILFDLSGHTSGNKLLIAAYRPAPVQISGIGYMNSTGLNCFDYFLTDKNCIGDWENFFVEKAVALSRSHFCYTPLKKFPAPSDAPCVEKNFVTFGCFNNFSKVTDKILSAWREILSRTPQSRLILKHKIFDNAEGKNFVRERLKKLDFDLSAVEMRGYGKNYLAEYAEIDIALDTFPYTGGLTTCEALNCGVPVISLYGDRHGTRFGLSILKNVGLEGLAVSSVEEYIERAVGLAAYRELLSVLHKNLPAMLKNSALMDVENYVREVEEKYFEMLRIKNVDG